VPNYGFVMKPNSTNSRHICSSEYSTTVYRPKIAITYRESYTPEELSLNTEIAYWIKDKTSGHYLTAMYNQWQDGSEIGVTSALQNPTLENADVSDI